MVEDRKTILKKIHEVLTVDIGILAAFLSDYYALKALLNHRADDITQDYIVIGVERLRGPVERVASRILDLVKMGDSKI